MKVTLNWLKRYVEFDWPPEELNPPPVVTGEDLKALGIPQGPIYKVLLERVREAQLDGVLSNKEEAVAMVRRLLVSLVGVGAVLASAIGAEPVGAAWMSVIVRRYPR